MTNRLRRVLLASTLLVAAACSGDDGGDAADTTAPTPAPTSTAAGPASTVATGSSVGIELIDAGAEPRRALRLGFTVGASLTQTVEITQNIELNVAGTPQSAEQRSRSVAVHTVKSVDAGVATIQVSFQSLEVSTVDVGSLLDQLGTVVVTMRVDERGNILDLDTDLAGQLPGETQALLLSLFDGLRQAAFVLPEEPVGMGARWRTTTTVTTLDVPMTVSQDVVVTGIDDNEVAFDLSARFAPQGTVTTLPGLPATATLDTFTLDGTLSGQGQLATGQFLAQIASASTLEVAYTVSSGGQSAQTTSVVRQQLSSVAS